MDQEEVDQDYTFYFAQLAGQNPEVTPGKPQPGYYRTQSHDAVVIWRARNQLYADKTPRDGRVVQLEKEWQIDELFSQVCRRPVTDDAYEAFLSTKRWPEDIDRPAPRGIGDNSGAELEPHESLRAQINDMLDVGRSWLKRIGKIATKEHADKAANYADEFARLEKKGDEEQKRLKKPILEAGRKIDNAWKPVIGAAADAKREFKDALTEWLIAAKRAAQEEEARAIQEAKEKGELVSGRPATAVAGTRGRVSLRPFNVLVVTDMKAVAQYYLSMEKLPLEIAEAIEKCAKRALEGGAQIPGAELKIEQRAA